MQVIKALSVLVLLVVFSAGELQAQIAIANKGTKNATLMYKGAPMLKVGPLPEVAVFAVEWGSEYLNVEEWLDWMEQYGMGYARVYPENSWYPWVPVDADRRLFPFEVVRWQDNHPVVDLTKSNPRYWENFARVVQECADRDIVLHIQLYQRVFFQGAEESARWHTNYYYQDNNVNNFAIPDRKPKKGRNKGYRLWPAMANEPVWRDLHKQWVEHVLDAVGDNGNCMIDLQNEAAYRNDMTPEWIEYTLDIIEDWEQRTGNDILVGMDYDHFYKSKDPGLENALSNPRLELIMCEGSEGHVIPELVAGSRKPISEELAIKYRKLYKKPVVSANSPCYWPNEQTIKGWNPVTGPEEGYDPTISIPAVRQYQWASMLLKVQGAGVYAKSYPLDFSELKLRTYAQESRLLIDFFGSLKDYVALEISPDVVAESPVRYAHVLSAENEAVVYLHADGFKKTVTAGQVLRLQKLKMTDGSVEILLCHPATGVWQRENVPIQNGNVTINLPEFYEDLALHILSLDE